MHWTWVLASLAAAALLSGCASPGTEPPRDERGRYVISMTDAFEFDPPRAHVPVGATVVWRTTGMAPHDVSGYPGDPSTADFPEFSSQRDPPEGKGSVIGPGEEYERTFPTAGTWTVWCHPHHEQGMKGILTVG